MTHVVTFHFPGKDLKRYHKDLGERVLEIFNSDQVPDLFKSYVAEILEEAEGFFPFRIRTIPPLKQKALDLLNDEKMSKKSRLISKRSLRRRSKSIRGRAAGHHWRPISL